MKKLKNFFYYTISCMLTLCFTACEKDGPDPNMIWDFAPIEIHFTLTGENGEDLLNPATAGNYTEQKITATYQGKTHEKDVFEGNKTPPYSRVYLAQLYGIYTTQLKNGRYALKFGELDGDDTYKDAIITLNWGDGTSDVVTFSSKLKWKGNDPQFTRTFKLNGKEVAKNTRNPVIDVKKTALKTTSSID